MIPVAINSPWDIIKNIKAFKFLLQKGGNSWLEQELKIRYIEQKVQYYRVKICKQGKCW